jgi:hypothetical protein
MDLPSPLPFNRLGVEEPVNCWLDVVEVRDFGFCSFEPPGVNGLCVSFELRLPVDAPPADRGLGGRLAMRETFPGGCGKAAALTDLRNVLVTVVTA